MDKSHPLSTLMIVGSLNIDKGSFRPQENDEELLGPIVPYLSVVGALTSLSNYTWLDIAFVVNLLSKIYFFTYKKTTDWSKTYTSLLLGSYEYGLILSKQFKIISNGLCKCMLFLRFSQCRNSLSQIGYFSICGSTKWFHGDL